MRAAPIRPIALPLLAVAALLPAARGAAAQDGPPPRALAPPAAHPRTPDVAVDGDGRAVAVWTGRAGDGFAVYGRVRPTREAAWAPVARLSAVAARRPPEPAVAAVAGGPAVVLWRVPGGPVRSATLPAGRVRGWTARAVATGGEGFTSPAVAAVGPGAAVAVWADRAGGAWRARRARLAGGTWRADPPLGLVAAGVEAPGALRSPPALAVGGDGAVAVIWPGPTGPPIPAEPVRVAVALWPRGAPGWGAAVVLSERGAHGEVALGRGGHAAAVWVEGDDAVLASVREPGAAAWPAPEALAAGLAATPAFPHVGLNREGYAVASWGETEGDTVLRARVRSGASGLWGPALVVFDDFSLLGAFELRTLEAAIDEDRAAYLAWTDPEGPGSASAYAARATSGAWSIAARVGVLEDIDETALAAGGGAAVLAATRARLIDEPHIDVVASAFPAPPRVALTAAQLRIGQRIAQAAVRRVNAAMARLRGGIGADGIRDGTLAADRFGPGVVVEGTPTGAAVPSGAIAPLAIAPPGPAGPVRLTAAQLRIGQRVAQAALVRTNVVRQTLSLGLTGEHVEDGAVGAVELLPGLRVVAAAPSPEPLPESPRFRPGTSGGDRVALSVAQVRVNQRIAQAAVLRANWLVERFEGGLTGRDVRAAGLRAQDLAPALRG